MTVARFLTCWHTAFVTAAISSSDIQAQWLSPAVSMIARAPLDTHASTTFRSPAKSISPSRRNGVRTDGIGPEKISFASDRFIVSHLVARVLTRRSRQNHAHAISDDQRHRSPDNRKPHVMDIRPLHDGPG